MRVALLVALAGTLAFGCQAAKSLSQTGSLDTHEAMIGINPAALTLWDVTNNAMNDEGGLDPARLDNAAWSRIQSAAEVMEQYSRPLAQVETIRVGAHNDEVEGFATRAEIQAMIDADPEGFRILARRMADHASELAAAAKARDVQQTAGLAESLSERCQACHSRYWEKPSADRDS